MGVRRRRHTSRDSRFRWLPFLIGLAAVFVLLAGGAAYAGYRYDRSASTRILPGVSIDGVEVGEMTRTEALRALEGRVSEIVDRKITVRSGSKVWHKTAGDLGTAVDVEAAVDHAFSAGGSMGWPFRVYHRLLHKPVQERIQLSVTYHRSPVEKLVSKIAEAVERPARDASLDYADGQLVMVHSENGAKLKKARATRVLQKAVKVADPYVKLSASRVAPEVGDDQLGKTIIIHVSDNRLELYDGFVRARSYPVATGQPQYPTPQGHWVIVNKRINPTWVNPALDSWGAGSPAYIPPGPDNPLGTRALDLNASGIRIHGTYADGSIGTHASHGCIRMHIPDSEQLFGLVEVGTPVIIVP